MRKGDGRSYHPFEVLLVAEKNGPVVTTGGMKVIPDHTFESYPQ